MSMIKNDRFLRALLREPVDRTPVWLMRQAVRAIYRSIAGGSASGEEASSFMAFCKTPELACEATLQTLARFPLDAAIIFSDILTVLDAMGVDFAGGAFGLAHDP